MGSDSMIATESPLGHLPEGWTLVRLREITTKIGSGATPRGGQSVYLDSRQRVALIRSQNVFDRHFSSEGLAFITDEHAEQLLGAMVQAEDLLLNITGDGITFGRACLAPEETLPACVNQHVSIVRPDRKLCSPGFLLSYLTHPLIKGYIESFNSGGSRRAITKGHIDSFEVPLPPIVEQERIADILGSLDNKIELNRQMNATLEAMAQALFRSWFVDFDPVTAKAAGRQPFGMNADTAALFPDRFVDSDLGPIPEGWRIGTVGDIGANPRRGVNPSTIRPTIPYIGLEHMPRRSITLGTWGRAEEVTSGKSAFNQGEILFGKLRPYFHKIGVALIDGVCSTDVIVVTPREEHFFGLLLGHLSSVDFINYVDAASGGTRMPRTSWSDMRRYQIVVPPDRLCESHSKACRVFVNQLAANVEQSRTLSSLRDILLPKLLSGEIRVGQAERIIEEVA